MADDGLVIKTIWINVASFCSLSDIGKLQSTCKYLNAILSCNSVWKIQWTKLCSLFDLKKLKEKYTDRVYSLPHVPFVYQNLCYRLLACLRRRECSQQWFVMNPLDEIESFNIAQNLTSFTCFGPTQKMRRAELSWLRSALSTVIPLRRLKACDVKFLDAATDHMLLGTCSMAQKYETYADLWPFRDSEKNAFYNHRIAVLLRKKTREKCLSQIPGLECGMPQQFCSHNQLGSGWKLRRRVLRTVKDTTSPTIKVQGIKNFELKCSIQELLRPGLIRDFSLKAAKICLRTPINMNPKDLEIIQDLFFRVLGYTHILPFNVASQVSDKARAETCLIIESYVHHTVITPIIDGIVCSDLVRCKPIGFSHVLDYLVLSLVVQNPNLSKTEAPSLMLNCFITNPEHMTLALSPSHDLRAAVRPENPSEYAYMYNSQHGVLHTGTALQLKESILCVLLGVDSCEYSDFLVLLATEYMYKCLDLVSMVTELLSQFDLVNVRRLVSHIFFVGENTRIGSFRERFERDLRASLNKMGAVLGGEFAQQQQWPIHCVHAEVEDRPNCLFSDDTLSTMDYIFQGPDSI